MRTCWTIEKQKIYRECIKHVSLYMDMNKGKYTAFDGSTALAIAFNMEKEETLRDIIHYREKGKLAGD